MSVALQGLALRQIVADLRKLDDAIQDASNGPGRHSQVLNASHKNFDARSLYEIATNYKRATMTFEAFLISLAGRAETAKRSTGRRPPRQIGIGQFSPSFGGDLAEMQALCRRLPRDLAKLDEKVNEFCKTANDDIKSPLRTPVPSSPAPLEPGTSEAALWLFDFVLQVSDMAVKIKERWF